MTDLRWKFLLTGREKSKISPHTLLGNLVVDNGHNYDGNDGDDDSNGDGNDGDNNGNGDGNDDDVDIIGGCKRVAAAEVVGFNSTLGWGPVRLGIEVKEQLEEMLSKRNGGDRDAKSSFFWLLLTPHLKKRSQRSIQKLNVWNNRLMTKKWYRLS